MECIFCKIITGEMPSAKIYEDENQIAFLDIFPASVGHTLLVPKQHHINLFDAPKGCAEKVYPALSLIANALRAATGCAGLNIVQNNEEAAGQAVFHSHIHLIPRYKNDGIKVTAAGKDRADIAAITVLAEKIKTALHNI
ncbi:MAG: HIT family protein [Deferribacteraceae bacterium]|jgi:histidine triad (HIT) family protein|nr:HIT family protein [Deferribacteraceae bacterium]